MLIRVEIPVDAPGIDMLLRRGFQREDEANLVQDLREDGLIILGVVATDDDGMIVGYVAFSPVLIDKEDRQWVALAPLVVDESWRGQGVARQLVMESVSILNEFSYRAVVTLGDTELYGRMGFESASLYHLESRWPDGQHHFMVRILSEEACKHTGGYVEYHEHFNRF